MKLFFNLLIGCILLISSQVFAAVQTNSIQIDIDRQLTAAENTPVFLSESGTVQTQPGQGDILDELDEASGEKGEEKKCMMVCEKWGEDCVINPRTGSRKCRRVCKQLAQQCF